MSAVSLRTTPEIMEFFKTNSPTLNGTLPITNTTFSSPAVVNCSNAFLDRIVNTYNNNNGTSILQSCVQDPACKADTDGCAAVCGKLGTQIVWMKSGLDSNQNRVLNVIGWDTLTAKKTIDAALTVYSKAAGCEFQDGKTSFTANPSGDPAAEKKKLDDASKQFETNLNDVKPGATPQEGWSIGTGLALVGAAGVGGAIVYGAQKVREKEQQNTTDAKSNRLPLSKFSKV